VANTFERIAQNPNCTSGSSDDPWPPDLGCGPVNLGANGMTPARIVADLPDLEEEDVREALDYAAASRRSADSMSLIDARRSEDYERRRNSRNSAGRRIRTLATCSPK
jgi:uncharacterized protein DUF433